MRTRGRGAGSSRLISGSRPVHATLERYLEDWLGQTALFFTSGYQANLAVFSTVCGAGEIVASDARNHASIIDGLRLSKAERLVVPHADPEVIPKGVDLVALEGLYSMDGDVPPFARYPTDPLLAVDEAHALGVLGPDGRGAAAASGVKPDILIGTFGKALGAAGAFVAGPPELKDLLVNAGRSFIFTTAPPESVAKAALEGLQAARSRPELREQVLRNATVLRGHLAQLGWKVRGSAHILPVLCGGEAMEIARRLLDRGVYAPGIRFPTVPEGEERIRITVSAAHTDEDLAKIAEAFGSRH
ncbi:MAG: aminotransferase class I/II-fold pyridoxal phosphate-dependent enzyme [Alphaproteobacteria bacterium]|nr:aminotransferase class I/II-fold pyridoxal phosphate-dependent enzyme [Alphaproteobacteria bacterium]